eukprot:gene45895-61341_t
MSARAPVGASNRSDLFGGHGHIENENKIDPSANDDEPIGDDTHQLEHMLGYAGEFRGVVLSLPHDESSYIKSMGALVAVENLTDPHKQRLLRGHDAQVSALATSSSGRMIASGQAGTKSFKGNAAPIFVWDTDSYRRMITLRGISSQVNLL